MINALNEIKEEEEVAKGKASNAWNSSGERENWIQAVCVCVMMWIIGSFPTYLAEVEPFFSSEIRVR